MTSQKLVSRSEEETRRIGEILAKLLPIPSVVGLSGTLGSGKTRLVQGIARGCGVAEAAVISPTFVLIHEYPGRVPVFHFDVYRLRDPAEFLELGPEEYFQRPGISVIEWAERVADYLPPDRLDIYLSVVDSTTREITFNGSEGWPERVVTQILKEWRKNSE